MEKYQPKIEIEPLPKDISLEFASMSVMKFLDFLDTLEEEPSLAIVADWKDESTAIRLKAFVEEGFGYGQKRSAIIRATREQKSKAENAFYSGVKWEEVKK